MGEVPNNYDARERVLELKGEISRKLREQDELDAAAVNAADGVDAYGRNREAWTWQTAAFRVCFTRK